MIFRLQGYYLLWPAFPCRSSRTRLCNSLMERYFHHIDSYDPIYATRTGLARIWFRLIPFRSPLLRESRLISIPPGTEMFHFPGLTLPALFYSGGSTQTLLYVGSPIRKSTGLGLLGASPWLIAAFRVLHLLSVPRHPPYALTNLIEIFSTIAV